MLKSARLISFSNCALSETEGELIFEYSLEFYSTPSFPSFLSQTAWETIEIAIQRFFL